MQALRTILRSPDADAEDDPAVPWLGPGKLMLSAASTGYDRQGEFLGSQTQATPLVELILNTASSGYAS